MADGGGEGDVGALDHLDAKLMRELRDIPQEIVDRLEARPSVNADGEYLLQSQLCKLGGKLRATVHAASSLDVLVDLSQEVLRAFALVVLVARTCGGEGSQGREGEASGAWLRVVGMNAPGLQSRRHTAGPLT